MFLLVWLVAEATAMVGHFVINTSFFPKQEIKRSMKSNIQSYAAAHQVEQAAIKWGNVVEVIHPYLGFVLDPQRNPMEVSEFGFDSGLNSETLVNKKPATVLVGVFGGSFAHGVFGSARALLKDCPALSGQEIIVANFASGGYKQPQQLLTFSYLLALRAQFDIVLNIDGFNEVALPYSENVPYQVYPFYPRMWHLRAATILDPVVIRQIGHIRYLEDKKQSWAKLFDDYGLYRSPLLALLWQFRDQAFAADISRIAGAIKARDEPAGNFVGHGPPYSYETEQALFADLARVWKNASIQMKLLSDGNNIRYYHFLQPNQYVKDSKPMSPEEIDKAIGKHVYHEGAEKGYPHLLKTADQLTDSGVNFTDLTMVYADHPEALYVDSCCHVNQHGYDIVVEQICKTLSR
jgi:hypothetical protein